jgi:hypothetical protein
VIGDTKVERPIYSKANGSDYKKQKAKKKSRHRAGTEPTIRHVKQDYRMQQKHLKGDVDDSINTMMATTKFNRKHWLNKA